MQVLYEISAYYFTNLLLLNTPQPPLVGAVGCRIAKGLVVSMAVSTIKIN